MNYLIIAVPPADAADLQELKESLPTTGTTIESKPFDGIEMLQVIVPVTATAIPVLTTWIKARFEHRRSQGVSLKGMKFTGYSPNEIEELTKLLKEEADTGDE